jgi:hypothetical protein
MDEIENGFQINKSQDSQSSVQTMTSLPDYHQKFFKIFFLFGCVCSSIIGVLMDKEQIFYNSKIVFSGLNLLKVFVYGLTYILFNCLLLSLVITFFLFLFLKCKKKPNKSIQNIYEENQFSFVNILVVAFIFLLIIIYILTIPLGLYLLVKLLTNENFKYYHKFYLLYLFVVLNILLGLCVMFAFIYILCFIHNKLNRKKKIELDETLVKKIEKEISHSFRESGRY